MSPGTKYTCIRQPTRSQAVTGKEINESNIGFQVETKGKEQSSGDAPENTPAANCNIPYSFSMPGCRLTVPKGSNISTYSTLAGWMMAFFEQLHGNTPIVTAYSLDEILMTSPRL